MSANTVKAADAAGFLTGPYDTWENAQDPSDSDSSTSVWPGTIYPDACALDEHGAPLEGFGGRGCALSSSAIDREEQTNGVLGSRVRQMSGNGVKSYFLDVDATGDLIHDFSPVHPQTRQQDRGHRLARMLHLAAGGFSDQALVLGSEKAEWWATPALAFSHGSSTAISNGIWDLQKNKDEWGSYWPADRPAFFFKPVTLPDPLYKEMIDPAYRIPLYQAVLGDTVLSTDRWEMGLHKFEGLETERTLLNMLYNNPPMLALDHSVLDQHGPSLAAMQKFFAVIQDRADGKPLTHFERLSPSVQRTSFGAPLGPVSLVVTANFGNTPARGVPPRCVTASAPTKPTTTYCPDNL